MESKELDNTEDQILHRIDHATANVLWSVPLFQDTREADESWRWYTHENAYRFYLLGDSLYAANITYLYRIDAATGDILLQTALMP